MADGIAACGDSVHIFPAHGYRQPEAEIAVFYGFDLNLRKVFADYRALGRPVVYVDLGYWGRRQGGPLAGYHKVVVNGRHPTAYFQAVRHDAERAAILDLEFKPWGGGGNHIIVAGMSAKCAEVEGFAPSEWEKRTVAELRRYTSRPIVYRPKPSWADARPISGTTFEPSADALPRLLTNCHAVVTHHSNVAIDAMLAGVPAFSVEGPATALCLSDLAQIESPIRPDGREQLACDLAWTQFTVAEMRTGLPWRHLLQEGLIS